MKAIKNMTKIEADLNTIHTKNYRQSP